METRTGCVSGEKFNPCDYSRYEDLPEDLKATSYPGWQIDEEIFLAIDNEGEREAYQMYDSWEARDGVCSYKPSEWKSQVEDVVSSDTQYTGGFVKSDAIESPSKAEEIAYLEEYIRDTLTTEPMDERLDDISHSEFIIEHMQSAANNKYGSDVIKKTAEWARKNWYIRKITTQYLASDIEHLGSLPLPLELALIEEGLDTSHLSPRKHSDDAVSRAEEAYRQARYIFEKTTFAGKVDDPEKAQIIAHTEDKLREKYAETSPEHLSYILENALEGFSGNALDTTFCERVAEWAFKIWYTPERHEPSMSAHRCIELEDEVQVLANAKAKLKKVSDLPDPIKRMHAVNAALIGIEDAQRDHGHAQVILDYLNNEYLFATGKSN